MLNENYWQELQQGFSRYSVDVFHVVLHVDSAVLAQRINADELEQKARQWRLDHISVYTAARTWMQASADLVVDCTSMSAADAARTVRRAVQPRT